MPLEQRPAAPHQSRQLCAAHPIGHDAVLNLIKFPAYRNSASRELVTKNYVTNIFLKLMMATMKLSLGKKLLAFQGAIALGLVIAAIPATSFAEAAPCKSVGLLGFKMAETRDSGKPYEDVYAGFLQMRRAGKIDQNDFDQSILFLKYVYTDGRYETPARIRQQITALCEAYR